jgi:hypothetical protein
VSEVRQIAGDLHDLIESDMTITVPFGTSDGLERLRDLTQDTADELLGYGKIEEDVNIEIKSSKTPLEF